MRWQAAGVMLLTALPLGNGYLRAFRGASHTSVRGKRLVSPYPRGRTPRLWNQLDHETNGAQESAAGGASNSPLDAEIAEETLEETRVYKNLKTKS